MNRLYLIIGDEELFRSRALARIEQEVMGAGAHDLDLDRIDGTGATPESVLQLLRTPSWMSPARLVIMKDGEAFVSVHADALIKIAEGDSGVLVIEAAGIKKGKLPKGLKGDIIDCSPVPIAALPKWIESEARQLGTSIASDGAFLLSLLAQEMEDGKLRGAITALEVLALFVGGRNIERADVESFFSGGGSVSVFKWADTVLASQSGGTTRSKSRSFPLTTLSLGLAQPDPRSPPQNSLQAALGGVEQLLLQGEIPFRLIGLLSWFVQKKISELKPHADEKKIWRHFEALAGADVTLKSLPIPPASVMSRLVLGLGGYL